MRSSSDDVSCACAAATAARTYTQSQSCLSRYVWCESAIILFVQRLSVIIWFAGLDGGEYIRAGTEMAGVVVMYLNEAVPEADCLTLHLLGMANKCICCQIVNFI